MNEKLKIVGIHDENTILQMEIAAEDWRVHKAVLCADGHKGYSVPIGGVLVSKEHFAPCTVGFDIACGMKAVKLNVKANGVRRNISRIMDDVARRISFGVGRSNNTKVDHDLFDDEAWKLPVFQGLKDAARTQLGTVGGGNHFTNLSFDENDNVWATCHFGSRGLGHKTATWFLEKMGAVDDMDSPPMFLHERSALGEEYIQAINLAGRYAYAGRDWVCDELADILGAKIVEEVHLHHNFLWKEEHYGEQFWVGRKGSTPAFPGQRGMIGASMCEPCVIVEGVDSELSKELFFSTIHGAGRVMSRTEAKGKRDRKTGELLLDANGVPKKVGAVSQEMMDDWVKRAGVELRGGNVDESPFVYKRLPEVLAHHEGTIRVLHILTPVGVAMAPKHVIDPYKD